MALAEWLIRTLKLDATTANTYADKFRREGIDDNEQHLPELNLTVDDLAEMKVEIGHRQRLLTAIQALRNPAPAAPTKLAAALAVARRDLIVRLVPVVISVGFVARLAQMQWLSQAKAPDYFQWQEIFRLVTAMFAVVSGWEWYHRDVDKRPLYETPRFLVDVLVIVAALVFLFSSRHTVLWFGALIAIFVLYVLWDIFSILEFPDQYDPPNGKILSVYCRGFHNSNNKETHIAIVDIFWLVFFYLPIAVINWSFVRDQFLQVLLSCVFVWWGGILISLDVEKNYTTSTRCKWILSLIVFYSVLSYLLYRMHLDGIVSRWFFS